MVSFTFFHYRTAKKIDYDHYDQRKKEVARRSMREMKCSKEHVTMVKIVVECLKSNQGEITTLSREGVTNVSFEA